MLIKENCIGLLINDDRLVDERFFNSEEPFLLRVFREACEHHKINVLQKISDSGKMKDINKACDRVLRFGENMDNEVIIKKILSMRTSPFGNDLFTKVCFGCSEDEESIEIPFVVEVLLTYPHLNPGANNNEAFIVAASYLNIETISILLKDSRVNPADNNNEAIKGAVRFILDDTMVHFYEKERIEKTLTTLVNDSRINVLEILKEVMFEFVIYIDNDQDYNKSFFDNLTIVFNALLRSHSITDEFEAEFIIPHFGILREYGVTCVSMLRFGIISMTFSQAYMSIKFGSTLPKVVKTLLAFWINE
eukprot:Pgem_evm1s5589